ncbi:uncharacterized protein LY89DRAFT_145597 [Mollisia scopiformis]|uniref:Uncharacterized protein n=1 Tax=Mollisia scopiformis TaxID=149040 RepID=A0A194X148_MOLSC|nr:uncharacterized protein LY89DRAFT_145597 [Mollisia scopiformis]KUJ13694.1 hypothetical protein LY89DRAFT_145597 [Mollisia scopiformis]
MVSSIAQPPDKSVDLLIGSLRKSANSKEHLETAIRDKELVPLWNTGDPPAAPEPHTKHIPAVWRYEDTKSLLLRAAELVDAKEAERRTNLCQFLHLAFCFSMSLFLQPVNITTGHRCVPTSTTFAEFALGPKIFLCKTSQMWSIENPLANEHQLESGLAE